MNLRRFTIRRGNAKLMYATLRGQNRKIQPLTGATVTFSLWRDKGGPLVLDHVACTILDALGGRVRCDAFTGPFTLTLIEGSYYGRFDVMLSGAVSPLTFPDGNTPLLVLVTDT